MGRNELESRVAIENPAVNDSGHGQSGVCGPQDLLVQRIFIPVGLAGSIGGVEEQRPSSSVDRIPEKLEFRLIEIFSRNIGGKHDPVHTQLIKAPRQLTQAVIHVNHGEPCECLESLGIPGVGLRKRVVDQPAQPQGPAPVSPFFDDLPRGAGEDAHVYAILVHDIQIFLAIEGPEPHPSDVVF